jgi:release factor glutamine methyltransferase
MTANLRDALTRATASLADITDTPRLDSELLMAFALGVDRNTMLLRHLNDPVPATFDGLFARRVAHEPIAYITGTRDFWTITLDVAPGILVPRPDSETLIEAAIAHFSARSPKRILDLGTGSGALLLATLSHWPEATGVGVDASTIAVEMAAANAARLGLAPRASIRAGDWAAGIDERFDLVLCNPPYVETSAALAPEVRDYEPASALFAGADGLDDYRRLAPVIPQLIAPRGCAILEIGWTQANAVSALLAEEGLKTTVVQDLGKRDRAVVATG